MPIYGTCPECGYTASFYELRRHSPVERVGRRNHLSAICPECRRNYVFDPLPKTPVRLGRAILVTLAAAAGFGAVALLALWLS